MTAWSKRTGRAAFVRTCFDADDALVEGTLADHDRQSTNYLEYAGGYVEDHGDAGGSKKKSWGTDFPRRNSISFFSISVLCRFL